MATPARQWRILLSCESQARRRPTIGRVDKPKGCGTPTAVNLFYTASVVLGLKCSTRSLVQSPGWSWVLDYFGQRASDAKRPETPACPRTDFGYGIACPPESMIRVDTRHIHRPNNSRRLDLARVVRAVRVRHSRTVNVGRFTAKVTTSTALHDKYNALKPICHHILLAIGVFGATPGGMLRKQEVGVEKPEVGAFPEPIDQAINVEFL
ncbi:hypothetical protein F5J12DRAFT_781756 [Pisolithus orientalis]|uniref:uncharacterized protein n=1 Tax=Pisolithus orientalis TaxID=936130 RepID=UPI00222589AC|nr:uncharacterized protein F5J12DRAFT_781756 [Pisolithus orientalis]KAI6010758.1 hypothetical protein F5J12DRAFT_781756 [Pisolithus orientalis]